MNVQLHPSNVKLDFERPEYHRAIAVQDSQTGQVHAFSTGSQLSSRLLSAKSVNCFVYLPKAKSKDDLQYQCTGNTLAYLIGTLISKSTSHIQEMSGHLQGQQLKTSGCGGHHGNTQGTNAVQIPKNLTVGLITISDRAHQGQYETGDLSGKAMQEVVTSNPNVFGGVL